MAKKTLPRTLLVALLGSLVALAVIRPARDSDPLAADTLARLLAQPVDPVPGAPATATPPETEPFWRALLAPPFVEPRAGERVLALGRVLADPSAARGSAESAGELLALEAEGPDGPLGVPLWRALLERAAESEGAGRTLRIYGCRHSADPDAGPALEDTYHARLALARALQGFAASEAGAAPLTIRGAELPVKGGVNFEVQLDGERQWVRVSFDGSAHAPLRAQRNHRPSAPNDARARARLVAALRAHSAAQPERLPLRIEGAEASVAGGVDLRLELLGSRLELLARRGTARVGTHLELGATPSVPSPAIPLESGPPAR